MNISCLSVLAFMETVCVLKPFEKEAFLILPPVPDISEKTTRLESLLLKSGLRPLYGGGGFGLFETNQLHALEEFVNLNSGENYHIGVVLHIEDDTVLVNSTIHRVNRTAYFIASGDDDPSLSTSLDFC